MAKRIKGAFIMLEFSLWKELKKRLRRRRSLLTLGSITLFLFSLAAIPSLTHAANIDEENARAKTPSVIRMLKEHDGILTVKMHRLYICGEEMQPLGRMAADQIVRMLVNHPEWTAVMANDGKTVLLEQNVADLSEECRTNAYIGMDKKGNLSLFEGEPKKEKVMRTFFQLDVHYMESSLPQEKMDQLANGIKISDIDEYNSVLSTFSDFALQENENVMKPTY
ncbi:MAG: BofC C-terminal domain-containing protein [Candidatus Pristimantibacillus sp.]